MHSFNIQEIPASEIVIGKTSVRVQNIGTNIDDLVDHIRVHGLLKPITVFKNSDGDYEILAGQRRFVAIKQLGQDKIWCNVRDPPVDDTSAKAISLGENLTQLPMTPQDKVDACTFLFEKYGSEKLVSEKCGISVHLVKTYVSFSRLFDSLKNMCKDGSLGIPPKKSINIATRAADSLNWEKNGDVKDEKVVELTKLLAKTSKISSTAVNDLIDEAKKDNTRTVEEIKAAAEKPKTTFIYKVIMYPVENKQLNIYADEQGLTPEDTIHDLTVCALTEKLSSDQI